MSRRKVSGPDPKVLDALKEALRNGQPVDADGEQAIEEMRRRTRIVRRDSGEIVRWDSKAGVNRYLRPGEKGPGRLEPALGRELAVRQRDFETELVKLRRRPPAGSGVAARKAKAAKLEADVLRLAAKYADRGAGANAIIADKLDISADHVRRIRRKNKPT